jgi:hypothetical protein
MAALLPYRCLAAALFALAPVAGAQAVPVAAPQPATAQAAMLFPLKVIKQKDLNFGYVAPVTGAGTVIINPNTNAVTVTGGVQLLGGAPHPALFTGAAKSNSVVIIRIPKQPITVTRVGGSETMTVANFTLQGLDKREVAAKVAFDFQVGATLNVNAGQAEGLYVGTFEVSVQYP